MPRVNVTLMVLVLLQLSAGMPYARQATATNGVSIAIAIAPEKAKHATKLADALVEQLQQGSLYKAIQTPADDIGAARKQAAEQKASYLIFAEVPQGEGHLGGLKKKVKVPYLSKSDAETKTETVSFVLERMSDAKQISTLAQDWAAAAKDEDLAALARAVSGDFSAKVSEDLTPTTTAKAQDQPGTAATPMGRPRLVVQTAHSAMVIDFAYSKDGEIAATLGADGVLKLWAAKAGTEFRTFAGYRLKGVAMSPDGSMLATVDQKSTVRIIDTHGGVIVKTIPNPNAEETVKHSSPFDLSAEPTPIAYSADGRLVVYGGPTGASVIDAAAGHWLGGIGPQDQSVEVLALDPSGKLIATVVKASASGKGAGMEGLVHGTGGNHFQVFRTSDRKAVANEPFPAYVGSISALAFDKDGKRLLVGSRNGSIRIFNPISGEEISKEPVLLNPCDKFYAANRLMDKGKKILGRLPGGSRVSDIGGVNKIENVDVGKLAGLGCETLDMANKVVGQGIMASFMQPSPAAGIRSLDLSADGHSLAYGLADNSIKVRDLANPGKEVSIATSESGDKAQEGKQLPRVLFGSMRSPVKLSYDGTNLFVNAIREFKTVNRWDAGNGKSVSALAVARRDLSPFPIPLPMGAMPEFSKDGTHLLTASLTNGVKLWDLRTGGAEQVSDLPAFSRYLPVSADGNLVVAAVPKLPIDIEKGPQMTIIVNETGSGREVLRLQDESRGVGFPMFSPDSRFIAINGDVELRVYELKTGKKVFTEQRAKGADSGGPNDAAFSPNGEYLAYQKGDALEVVRTSDWSKTVTKAKLTGGTESRFFRLSSLTFDADSTNVALIDDGKIKLWDLQSGKTISHTLPKDETGGAGDAASLVFAPSKKRISYTTDRSLFHWDYDVDKETKSALATDFWGNLAYSNDGTILALGGAENRVRLFDVEKDVEIGSLVAPSKKDWIMITPDGRLDASRIEEIDEVHWIVRQEPIKAQPLELFTRDFYEPRLLPRLLKHEKFAEIPDLSGRNRALPKVEIAEIVPNGDSRVKVKVVVQNTESAVQHDDAGHPLASGAQKLRLFRDGRLVGSAPEGDGKIKLDAGGRATFEFSVAVPNPEAASKVDFSAYAFNGEMAKSLTAHKDYEVAAAPGGRRGKAYIIAIGVNSNQVKSFNLSYAANDAAEMSAEVSERLAGGHLYSNVIQIPLIADSVKTEGLAKKENVKVILDVLAGRVNAVPAALAAAIPATKGLKKATPDDLVLVFFAGHGFADDGGAFFLIPADLGKDMGTDITLYKSRSISSDELSQWLQAVDSRDLVMIIDACQSAAAVEKDGFKPGPMGSRGLGQMAYDKGMQILAATQRNDVALESDKLDHGLLTFALVNEGLVGKKADFRPIDKRITLSEWLRYGVKRVPEIDEGLRQGTFETRGGIKKRGQQSAQSPSLFDFQWNREDTLLSLLP